MRREEADLGEREGQGGRCGNARSGRPAARSIETAGHIQGENRLVGGIGPLDELRNPSDRIATQAVAYECVDDEFRRTRIVCDLEAHAPQYVELVGGRRSHLVV